MNSLTLEDVKRLTQHEQNPKISAFMPTFRAGPDVQQNPTRLKNLISDIEQGLIDREMPDGERAAMLEPLRALMDDAEFWKHPQDGLAIFGAPDELNFYWLPYTVEERLVISQHYVFTPVLPLFTSNGRFYVLALSQNQIRLFEGTRYEIHPVALPDGAPADIDDALGEEVLDRELQMHSNVGQGTSGGIFHGSSEDNSKDRIQRYLNLVDDALKPLLRDQRTPLVLAGVEYLQPIYRQMSEYAHIMEEGIGGNPENMRPEELHALALPIVEPVLREATESAVSYYNDRTGTEKSTHDLRDIVSAAVWARVDTLLANLDAEEWGTFDAETNKVVRRREGPRTYEDLALVDFAAMHTLLNGGQVYALRGDEMPVDQPLAAVLRY